MTFKDLEREQIVDELLLDADLADTADVRQVLLAMGHFSDAAAPAPSKELAAMLAGPHDEVTKRRWRHKHRTAVVGVAVVAAMGLGVSGVAAASSGFTRSPSFEGLFGSFVPHTAPAAPVVLAPDAPKVSTAPAPSADPAAIPQPVQPVRPTPATVVAAPMQIPAPVLAAPQPIRHTPARTIPAAIPPAPHPAAPQPPAADPAPPTPDPMLQSSAAPSGKYSGSGLPSLSDQQPFADLKAAAEKLKQLKKPVER
ncbi:hypothetical protein [Paenarthrobacter nitroguajacolicus]|uniref:hypothetical protein n=1 Tax=Paenarthrobacter nitroguajacolicus TaxID=211146 RepID=UPI00248A9E00|nr:hypothetical protein [Paenarthrobacter nitroguajacolicus]MDI2036641.1 hypothetical protein [Paenarthrobacter nitroguajacolicus]